MNRCHSPSLITVLALIAMAHLGGVFGLKAYRSEQELDSLRAQVTRLQTLETQMKLVREDRQSRVRSATHAGRLHARTPADRIRAQLDQMVAGLSGATPQRQESGSIAALASDASVLILNYRAVVDCNPARLTGLLDGLAQARPGLLVTGLAIEPSTGASLGTLKLTLDGVALLEP